MSVHSLPHSEKNRFFELYGPLIPIRVEPPASIRSVLIAQGKPIPHSVDGMALIDTGANISAIDVKILTGLGCTPIDHRVLQTSHQKHETDIYMALISFPTIKDIPSSNLTVAGCVLNWEVEDDNDIIMLIGRDMLVNHMLVYDGIHNHVTLCF